jgi:uncharacterized protein with gpF-like domain
MASQPPTTEPDEHRRAEAAALIAIGLSLPAIIRAAKIKPRPFRQIAPTEALRSSMAAVFLDIVKAWRAERPAIMAAYAEARATGDARVALRAVDDAAARVAPVVASTKSRLPDVVSRVEAWHRGQWVRRVQSATGLNVAHSTTPADVRGDIQTTVDWASRLADDVSRKIQNDITSGLLGDLAAKKPVADAGTTASDVIAKAKRRSLGIGVDQTDKLSRSMDRSRRKAAGLTRFIWRHSPHVRHPRPEHVARDGRVYSEANAPNDRAGVLFGCACYEEPIWTNDQP